MFHRGNDENLEASKRSSVGQTRGKESLEKANNADLNVARHSSQIFYMISRYFKEKELKLK